MDPTPVAVVERFVAEVMNGGRPESASVLVASDPLRHRVQALRSSFADLRVEIVRIVVDDRLVAVHLTGTGTHTGLFQGNPPTGRSWSSSCTAIFDVADGSIIDFWLNWDTLGIVEQLGVVRRSADASA